MKFCWNLQKHNISSKNSIILWGRGFTHTYQFFTISVLDISVPLYPGPDKKTDIVEPICPLINGDIGFNFIGSFKKNNIVEPICPFINGLIGLVYIRTVKVEPIYIPFIIGQITLNIYQFYC